MAIVVKIDTSAITEKIEGCFDDDAKLFFYNTFYNLMQPYVPADTLTMYDTADISADGILFVQPYSSAPYYGKTKDGKQMNFKTDKHALATDHWDKAAWTARKDDLTVALQEYINRRNRNG